MINPDCLPADIARQRELDDAWREYRNARSPIDRDAILVNISRLRRQKIAAIHFTALDDVLLPDTWQQ